MRAISVAPLVAYFALTASVASGQTPSTPVQIQAVLSPGMTVWLTDASGQESKARIVEVSGGVVTTSADGAIRRLNATDIRKITVRVSDSVLNGALSGAGAALAPPIALCSLFETLGNCVDDPGPIVVIGAIGAGVGIIIDALVRGRRTIYEVPPNAARLQFSPTVFRRGGGLQVVLSF